VGVLERIRATRAGRWSVKMVVGVAGGAVVVLGLIMVPAPGPGWLVVIGGLSVLAIEFAWARHMLELVRSRVLGWTHWIGARSLMFRGVVAGLGLVLLAALFWASLKFTLHFDVVDWTGQQLRR
jgi:uncharacterized protein (TIGR02611 family)